MARCIPCVYLSSHWATGHRSGAHVSAHPITVDSSMRRRGVDLILTGTFLLLHHLHPRSPSPYTPHLISSSSSFCTSHSVPSLLFGADSLFADLAGSAGLGAEPAGMRWEEMDGVKFSMEDAQAHSRACRFSREQCTTRVSLHSPIIPSIRRTLHAPHCPRALLPPCPMSSFLPPLHLFPPWPSGYPC